MPRSIAKSNEVSRAPTPFPSIQYICHKSIYFAPRILQSHRERRMHLFVDHKEHNLDLFYAYTNFKSLLYERHNEVTSALTQHDFANFSPLYCT